MSEGPPPKKSKFKPKAEGKVASTANPLPSKGEPTVQTPSLIPASYPGDVKVQRMSNIVSELNPAFTTNTSFGSTISDASSHDIYGAGDVPSVFRGREASVYRPSGPGSRNSVQVHQVVDVPQPQFDTAPNTPIEEYIDYKPIDSHMLPRDTYNMNALSNGMPIIGTSHGLPGTDGPVLPAMHGLPTTSTAPGPYEEWAHAAPYSGFVPQDPNQGWAVPYYHHPQSHPEDEPFDYHYQGPNHEMPGAPLPANVIRGFTGHASGVGDSACPPGFTQYSITM